MRALNPTYLDLTSTTTVRIANPTYLKLNKQDDPSVTDETSELQLLHSAADMYVCERTGTEICNFVDLFLTESSYHGIMDT